MSNTNVNGFVPEVDVNHQLVNEQDDEDSKTTTELRKRFEHLRRITRKQSPPRMKTHPGTEMFGDVYSEFEDFYSRDQLHSLEKCFLLADHDQDGHLNALELKYWMEKHNTPITNMNLKQILKLADLDQDGALSFREFILLCKQIELKSIDNGGGGTIFDCFGEDTIQDLEYKEKLKKDGSFAGLRAEVHSNVKYFEDRIAEELFGPKPPTEEGYLERVREINQQPDFNLQEFFKHLRHPSEEIKEICKEEIENPRHVTTSYIVLDNNKGPQVPINTRQASTSFWDNEDDEAKMLVSVHPSSSHKFDNDYLSNEKTLTPEIRNSLTPEEGIIVDVEKTRINKDAEEELAERAARKSQTIQTSYERFYGSQSSMKKFIVPDLQEDFENLELNSPKNMSRVDL